MAHVDNKVVPMDIGPEEARGAKKVTPTEYGLSDNVAKLIESPEQMMKRVLLPDERVKSEFECYFPTDFVPRWKIVMLLITTCGLYFFVIMYKSMQQWCYKKKCCTPKIVNFVRGKLAITDKGRIICWNEKVSQVKSKEDNNGCLAKCCCPALAAPPTDYTAQMDTAVFSAAKIRQLTEVYTSSALCCCCCVDYDCCVEVSFETFRPSSDKFVDVRSKWDFYHMIQSILNTGISAVEATMGMSSNRGNVLYIVSNTQDVVHNGDIHLVLTELSHLYANIIAALPPKALPDVFVNTNKDVEGGKAEMPAVSDGIKGVVIVADNCKVTIPKEWLALLPGEEIICAHGEMFRMGCKHWIMTVLSLGYMYCTNYRYKKVVRYGAVLTTKRIIVLDIFQRAGQVPDHLANVTAGVRSYFPGKVNAGYYSSTTGKNELLMKCCCQEPDVSFKCGVLTEAGELSFKFHETRLGALPFAKALQMTECRRATPIKYGAVTPNAINYSDADKQLMPLMPGEQLLDKVEGVPQPVPFCGRDSIFGKLCMDCLTATGMVAPDVEYCCSLENCGRNCFPTCPRVSTCGFYPFNLRKDLLVTEYSLITYVRKSRDCCCSSMCKDVKDFGVVWVSNEMLIGHTLSIGATGHEDFWSRLCIDMVCGRMCCPIGSSTYSLVVQMEKNMSFNIGHTERNMQWLGDQSLLKNLRVLDNIQDSNYKKDMAAAAPASPMKGARPAKMEER